jgi:hypothetical protein
MFSIHRTSSSITPSSRSRRRPARTALLAAAAATAILVPAGAASARGGDWFLTSLPPGDLVGGCGATPVHLTFTDNREYERDTTLVDGTVVKEFTGYLGAHFVADTGAAVDQNISGPGTVYAYPNGDVRFVSRGHFNYMVDPVQAAQLGVPQIFTTTGGPIDFTQHADGSMTPVTIPHHVIDVCGLLGLG